MRKIALILMLMLPLLALHTHAQNKLKDVANKLEGFNKKLPIEKVHLHLDKPYYSVGDTIWVKAYVVDGNNQFSGISNLLYVDLIDSNDSIKTSLTLPIIDGQGWSAIALSDSLMAAGNYNIRAYTTVMRNYGTDYFFNKPLSIVDALPPKPGENAGVTNNPITPITTSRQAGNDMSLQFFPEGGNLVVGIASKVAFKAMGTDGLSRNASGYVIDKDNNRVTEFKSGHAGMGMFRLFPTAGNSYTAIVNTNGVETKYLLPNAAKQGYGLAVSQNEENIQVRIVAITPSANTQTLNLVAQANNQVLYSGKADLKNSGFSTSIPKKYFTEGIAQITLLTADFKPVAERLIFIKPANLKIDLAGEDRKSPGRSAFKIRVTDGDNDPAIGAFSVAITNDSKVPYNENDEVSIFSNLLLTADLKGYIEKPNYYFTDPSPVKEQELDNLLLTQGWRRFVWDDLLQDKPYTANYKAETGDVTGVVLNDDKKPVSGARVNLLFTTGPQVALDTVTDKDGRFVFNGVWPDKSDKYIVTATDKRQKARYTVELDTLEQLMPPVVKQPFIAPKAEQLEVYQKAAKKDFEELQSKGLLGNRVILKEVKVIEKKKAPTLLDVALLNSVNLSGKGNANTVVTFKDLTRCGGNPDLGSCLLSIGKLINVQYRPNRQNPFMGAFYTRGNTQPMAIIQDGVPVDNFYGSINDIASVEILRSGGYTTIYGARGAGGVIVITTKRGGIDYSAYENDENGNLVKRSLPPLSNVSFAPRREFYVPPYTSGVENIRPQQATIYWAPNIITNQNGSAVVEFPKEQTPGRYKIVIEGIDVNGSLGRRVYTYEVN